MSKTKPELSALEKVTIKANTLTEIKELVANAMEEFIEHHPIEPEEYLYARYGKYGFNVEIGAISEADFHTMSENSLAVAVFNSVIELIDNLEIEVGENDD